MPKGPVLSVAFSPDGRFLAACGDYLGVWGIEEGRKVVLLEPGDQASSLVFLHDGAFIAAGCFDGRVRVWNAGDGTLARTVDAQKGCVYCLAASLDSQKLASAYQTIHIWDTTDWRENMCLRIEGDAAYPADWPKDVQALAFSPDCTKLVACSSGRLIIWELSSGEEIKRINNEVCAALAFSPHGDVFAAASFAKDCDYVKLWDPVGLRVRFVLGKQMRVKGLCFSPDGCLLAAAGFGGNNCDPGQLNLWDVAKQKLVTSHRIHSGPLTSVAFSPKGDLLATGSMDGTVKLWRVETLEKKKDEKKGEKEKSTMSE